MAELNTEHSVTCISEQLLAENICVKCILIVYHVCNNSFNKQLFDIDLSQLVHLLIS